MHLHLDRRIKIQLVIFTVIALVAVAMMSLYYMKLPAMLFGVGRYTVCCSMFLECQFFFQGCCGSCDASQPPPRALTSKTLASMRRFRMLTRDSWACSAVVSALDTSR